jgi:hypothetical protein
MAVRLWTHGFDFFAPCQSVVYHLWSRAHRPTWTVEKNERQLQLEKRAAVSAFVSRLLRGTTTVEDMQTYLGLGHERSLEACERFMGVNFTMQTVEWASRWGGRDPIEFDLSQSSASSLPRNKEL